MKKSTLSILLLIVMILSITAVSAADDVTSDAGETQAVDEVTPDVGVLQSSPDTVTVTAPGDKNFTQLQQEIDDSPYGMININSNYVRQEGENDIVINKNFNIFGDDEHTIDANGLGGIFKVNEGYALLLQNVVLVNGNANNGGAIYNEGTISFISSEISNCNASVGGAIYNKGILSISGSTLDENTATTKGAALYSEGITVVDDSIFDNNKITTGSTYAETQADKCNGGGAIYNEGDLTVSGSTFTKNTAPHDTEVFSAGGAIYNNDAGKLLIEACKFEENSAVYGGAVMFEKFSQDTVAIKDSVFNNNQAWQGGAVNGNDLVGSLIVTGSNFTANKAVGPNAGQSSPIGGAFMIGTKSYTGIALDVSGCNFVDNDGGYMGGAIASSPNNDIKVTDSNFTGNTATTLGGAIVTGTGTNLTVEGSTFTNNQVNSMGGAIFIEPNANVKISDSTFTGNVDAYPVAVMSYQGNLELERNTFDDASVFNYGGEITSQINIEVLDNDTISVYDGNANLYATLTDDNGNFIRDSTFKFVINGENVGANIDVANKVYTATYTLPSSGVYTVSAVSSKGEEYTVKTGTIKNYKGTFTDLKAKINDASGTLDLDYNFAYDADLDGVDVMDCIDIDDAIVINGNGHTISGSNLACIFNIYNETTLNNIAFVNGSYEMGGAIYVDDTLTINDCIFENNTATKQGGAIYICDGAVIIITNSIFSNNKVTTGSTYADTQNDECNGGGAIYNGGSLTVTGSNFTGNTAPHDVEVFSAGGAIYNNDAGKLLIEACKFEENSAVYGGAVMFEKFSQDTVAIKDSVFNNNQAWQGGAVNGNDLVGSLIVTGSNFTANKAVGPNAGQSSPIGGAFMIGTKSYTGIALDVSGCNFVDNDGGYMGGAIASSPNNDIKVTDSNFTGNTATTLGGAIVTGTGTNLTVEGSTFTNNQVNSMGGAIFIEPNANVKISDSTFTGNVDAYPVAVMSYQGNLELERNTFDDASVFNYGGEITSQINVVVLNNETVTVSSEDVTLTANITDDNGNAIRDSTIKFVINGEQVAATYNVATKLYQGTYTLPGIGIYPVNVISTKDDELTVKTGAIQNIKGTYTDLQKLIDETPVGGTLVLPYDFAYTPEIDDSFTGNSGYKFIYGMMIYKSINIVGNGHTISGENTHSIFIIMKSNIGEPNITISNATLANGKMNYYGGAIKQLYGNLTVDNVVFENNTCRVSDKGTLGGAIYSQSNLTVTNSIFTNNTAENGGGAIGIKVGGTTYYTIDNCTFNDNKAQTIGDGRTAAGGAIFVKGDARGTISNCNFTGNELIADYNPNGGAIKLQFVNTATIEKCNFTSNAAYAGGAVCVQANYQQYPDVVIDDCKFNDNHATYGGAVAAWNGDAVTILTVSNSEFEGNVAPNGSAIYNDGNLTLQGNTINTAYAEIYNDGIILSDVNAVVLNNETYETAEGTYVLNATLTDDMGNKIYDPNLKFKVNDDEAVEFTSYDNGVYTYDAYAIGFEPKYIVNVTSTSENKLNVKTGTIKNLKSGTFTDLYARILDAQENHSGILDLPYDFTYNEEIDGLYSNGIQISDNITINGNGYTISGNNSVIIFDVTCQDLVTFNNVTFADSHGAISTQAPLNIINCTFINNNRSSDNGGAIYSTNNLRITGTTFTNNAAVKGGAIHIEGADIAIDDSVFTKNTAAGNGIDGGCGGAIHTIGDVELTIDNSVFSDNTAIDGDLEASPATGSSWGGAIDADDAVITNSKFDNNSARNGGAVAVTLGDVVEIFNSNFTDNKAVDGGAIYNLVSNVNVEGCTFVGNEADRFGGAINNAAGSELNVKESTFTDNAANLGSAIYNDWEGQLVGKLRLTNNTVSSTKAEIVNDGIIVSTVNITILNGETVNVQYGESVILNATFTDDNGNLILDLNFQFLVQNAGSFDDVYYKDGVYTTTYKVDQIGQVKVDTNLDYDTVTTGLLNISKADVVLTITANDTIMRKQNETIIIKLVDEFGNLLNETVKIYITNSTGVKIYNEEVTTENGTFTLIYTGLAIDKYVIVAQFKETELYNEDLTTKEFEVIELNTNGTYTQMQNLINNAEEGATIIIPNDIVYDPFVDDDYDYSEGIVINKNITIDGNGTTIDGIKKYRIFTIAEGITVTIRNLTLINGYADMGGAIFTSAKDLTISACNFIGNDPIYGGAMYINQGSVTVNEESSFENNTADQGGAIYVGEGTELTVNGATFKNNTATQGGGAIVVDSAEADIEFAIFKDNIAANDAGDLTSGGALWIYNSNVTIANSSFIGSKALGETESKPGIFASANGGAIKVQWSSNVTIDGCTFEDNYAPNGGAISIQAWEDLNNTVTINDCIFVNNTAVNGGAIYVSQNRGYTFVNVTDTDFLHNTAVNGGAVAVKAETDAAFDNCTFKDNEAILGGAIYTTGIYRYIVLEGNEVYLLYAPSVLLNTSTLSDNRARYGGAIYAANATIDNESTKGGYPYVAFDEDNTMLAIFESELINNTAEAGGAIYLDGVLLLIQDSNFTNNTAAYAGGAAFLYESFGEGDNTVFKGNVATDGGAIKISGSTYFEFDDLVFEENNATTGGAMSVQDNFVEDGDGLLISCNFTNNYATAGGAIYFNGTDAAADAGISFSTFTGNFALNGGAIAIFNNAHVDVVLSDFIDNKAEIGGAIYANASGNKGIILDVEGTDFIGNTVDDSGGAIAVIENVQYYINVCNFENNSAIADDCVCGGAFLTQDNAEGYIINSTFTNNTVKGDEFSNGGAIKVQFGGDVTIINCTFIDNYAYIGGAISTQAKTGEINKVEIEGSEFEDNEAFIGGAIASRQTSGYSTVYINNSGFFVNRAYAGGAIYLDNRSSFIIEESEFNFNSVEFNGGAIYALGDLQVFDSNFEVNTAETGGAIYVSAAYTNVDLLVSGSTFSENIVSDAGGAIAVFEKGSYDLEYAIFDCEFIANSAVNDEVDACVAGGAFFSEGATYGIINSSSFKGNKADSELYPNGGAVKIQFGGQVFINASNFTENTAGLSGGAIDVQAKEGGNNLVVISNCNFDKNTAQAGAAVSALQNSGKSTVVINMSTFTANEADLVGGAVYLDPSSTVIVLNTELTENTAVMNGGAIYGLGNLVVGNSTFANNKANAIYMTSGKLVLNNNTINKEVADVILANGALIVTEVNIKVINNDTIPAEYGQEMVLNATVCDDNGNLINDAKFQITVDGKNVTTVFNDETQLYEAEYTVETPGDKVVGMTYVSTDNLKVMIGILEFVKANVTEFYVIPGGQDYKIPYGENVTVYVSLFGVDGEGLNETFTVLVDNVEYTVTVENGTGSFNVSGLAPGEYAAVGMFPGNDLYNKAYATGLFTVLYEEPILTIDIDDAAVGETITAVINLEDVDGNPIDGLVSIVIGDYSDVCVVVHGVGGIELPSFAVGNYTANVIFNGDDRYPSANNTTTFKVTQISDYYMEAIDVNITYGEDANITVLILPEFATGNVTVTINNNTYNATVEDGKAVIVIPGLPAGNYTDVEVLYTGDINFVPGSTTVNITVGAADSGFDLRVIDPLIVPVTDYLKNVLFMVSINKNATGNISLFSLNGFKSLGNYTVEEARKGINITGLQAGYNIIFASYSGDDNFVSAFDVEILVVNPILPEISMEATGDFVVDGKVNVTVTVPEDFNGTVSATIDGAMAIADLVDGKYVIPFDSLAAGNHTVAVYLTNDTNYVNATDSISFTIAKVDPTIIIAIEDDPVVLYKSNVTVTLPEDATGYIVVYDGDNFNYIYLDSNVAKFVVIPTHAGLNEISVLYSGDDKYNVKANNTTYIAGLITDYEIDAENEEIEFTETAYIEVYLPALATGNVTITINGNEYSDDVVAGYAVIAIPGLAVGNYTDVVVTYSGDDYFAPGSTTVNITVERGDAEFEVWFDDDEINYGETGKVYVVIDDDATGNVTFYWIDESGKYVFLGNCSVEEAKEGINVTNLPAGYNYVVGKYSGDDNFTADSDRDWVYVYKVTPELHLAVSGDLVVDGEVNITFTTPEDADGYIVIYVDGVSVPFTGANGTYTVTLNNLTAGSHTAIADLLDDTNYNAAGKTVSFNISKVDPSIVVTIEGDAVVDETVTIVVTMPEDADGYIAIFDGIYYLFDEFTDGIYTTHYDIYKAGELSINVVYTGNDKYNDAENFTTVDVAKGTVNVYADVPAEIKVGENATVDAYTDKPVYGTVTVYVDGEEYGIYTAEDDIVVSGLTNGTHTIGVKYNGDDNYNASDIVNYTIEVSKVDISNDILVVGSKVTYGDNATITVFVPVDATGNVTVAVGEGIYSADVENGIGVISIPGLVVDVYEDLLVVYSGDGKYDPATGKANITVEKQFVDWWANDGEVTLNIGENVTIKLIAIDPEDAPGYISIGINGEFVAEASFDEMLSEGFTFVAEESGVYEIELVAGGDSANYDYAEPLYVMVFVRNNATANVTVPSDVQAGQDAVITVSIPNATGDVVVIVDGVEETVPLEDGVANYTISNATVGTHSIVVKYDGDEVTAPALVITELTVPRIDTVIVVDSTFTRNATDYNAGERGAFFYAVLKDSNGNLLANKTVAIAVNGPIYYVTTDSQGRAGLQVNLASANTYTYALSFTGDDEYNASPLACTKLLVIKKTTSIAAASTASFKSAAKTKTVTATLKTIKNAYDGKTYLKEGKQLTLTIDGKTYKATADGSGVAKFNIGSFTKKGTFNAVIKFAGDRTYDASSKTIKITIS